jgi:hypothetical protein
MPSPKPRRISVRIADDPLDALEPATFAARAFPVKLLSVAVKAL